MAPGSDPSTRKDNIGTTNGEYESNPEDERRVLVLDFDLCIDQLEAQFLRRVLMFLGSFCNILIDDNPVEDLHSSDDGSDSSEPSLEGFTPASTVSLDNPHSLDKAQAGSRLVAQVRLSHSDGFPSQFSAIINGISCLGYEKAAEVLQHVLELCLEEKELGGLQLRHDKPLTAADQDKVFSLIEAWLQTINNSNAANRFFNLSNLTDESKSSVQRRPMTLSEKIFAHHALSGAPSEGIKPGDVIRLSVDWVVASEVSWMGMLKTFEAIDTPDIYRNDRFWLAADHIVDPRNKHQPKVKRLVEKSERAERDFKMTDYQGENYTILHTEFVRQRAQPGMVVIGSDSHTCSSGALGCLAIGLGAADVVMPLVTGETWFKVPPAINIHLIGRPMFGIGGKDIILHILGKLKRNTIAAERIVEFTGPGAQYLSCDARFAICNMCTEFGAITGLFTPDATVQSYVNSRKSKLHKRSPLYFQPDTNAVYADTCELDLSQVEPYIAIYPSPDNVVPVTLCPTMEFDGVFIGACTTTEEDLILAALVLQIGLQQGRPLAKGKRQVTPGSLPIVKKLRELGLLDIYAAAGFEQSAPGCSFCIGMGADQARPGERWLSSQNRNFENRMGKGSIGTLSSAATVAASSFSMTLTSPAKFIEQVDGNLYKRYCNGGIINDVTAYSQSDLYLEPQIVVQDSVEPFAERESLGTEPSGLEIIKSKVQNLGSFVDTDALAPAEFLIESEDDKSLGDHCLQHSFPEFRDLVRANRQVIVAQGGFGCGSSREEAPRALLGLGVQCVIAKSFAFIYGRNQPALGLLGIVILDENFYQAVAVDGTDIEIDVYARSIDVKGTKFSFVLDDLELRLLENKGMSEAYKRFGKGIFKELCEKRGPSIIPGHAGGVMSEQTTRSTDANLEW